MRKIIICEIRNSYVVLVDKFKFLFGAFEQPAAISIIENATFHLERSSKFRFFHLKEISLRGNNVENLPCKVTPHSTTGCKCNAIFQLVIHYPYNYKYCLNASASTSPLDNLPPSRHTQL